MNDRTTNAALVEKYAAIAYAARSSVLSHPDRIAAVATLFGLTPPAIATGRVLEVGCSDGANLIPMAAALPDARFVGCDLSPPAIDAARRTVAELGLANVTLLEGDLRELPAELDQFDYIIAHGVYSWVPAPVREALFALASSRLAQNGVMFVSYNVYPGCHVRRAAWEVLHYHVDPIQDPRARLDAARELAALLAEPGPTQVKSDQVLRAEFRRLSKRSDSALFHDDLAEPNDPVYFHEFVSHAGRHRLKFLAEATPLAMSTVGLAPRVQQFLAGLEPLVREQYHDFARLRRFRQTLLCRTEAATESTMRPDRIVGMYVSASTSLARMIAEGKDVVAAPAHSPPGEPAAAADTVLRALLHWLDAEMPRAVSFAEVKAWLDDYMAQSLPGSAPRRPLETMLVDACLADAVEPYVRPLPLAIAAGERPVASPVARWQARRQESITNLRHEMMAIQDPAARQLLALLDGTRTRAELAAALGPGFAGNDPATALRRVDLSLRQFALHALLVG